jgi:hypothetical protein
VKRRIGTWAIAGFLIAGLWALYAASTFPSPMISAPPFVWTLVNIVCPIVFAGFHFHFGIKLYWVLLANAATYGLLGFALESLRQLFSHTERFNFSAR